MIRFRSVISRITFLNIVAVVIAGLCMPVALYFMLENAVAELHDRALVDQAREIADLIERNDNGELTLELPRRLQEIYSEAYGRYAYAVVDEQGKVLFSSLGRSRPVIRQDATTTSPNYFHRKRDAVELYGVSIELNVAGQPLWVQVAQDMAHRDVLIDDVVSEFFTRVGWITAPILLLLLAIEIVIVKRGMGPIVQASTLAAEIGPTRVDIRLPEDELPREVQPLVHAVNEALDRLEQGFKAQREFTADAAHELRTPLAVLRTHVDMIEDKSVAEALREDIAGLGRLVNQLLDIAELETFVIGADEVADIRAVCQRTATFLAPLAHAQGKRVVVTGANHPVLIRGNADTLGQAVRNLVENALVHTPRGTEVEARVTDHPAIFVCDQGPGVPGAERDLVFRRFWRRDRRRTGGAGLGLSIVQRIVEAHGGKVTVSENPGGGAIFAIRFEPSVRVELEADDAPAERPPSADAAAE
jgi:signal transduction histidine kinase